MAAGISGRGNGTLGERLENGSLGKDILLRCLQVGIGWSAHMRAIFCGVLG